MNIKGYNFASELNASADIDDEVYLVHNKNIGDKQ